MDDVPEQEIAGGLFTGTVKIRSLVGTRCFTHIWIPRPGETRVKEEGRK